MIAGQSGPGPVRRNLASARGLRRRRRWDPILVAFCALAAVRGEEYYLAPPGCGTGTPTENSQESPIPWDDAHLQTILISNPKNPSSSLIELKLTELYGTDYEIPPFKISPNTPVGRTIKIHPVSTTTKVTLRCARPETGSPTFSGLFNGSAWETYLLDFRLGNEIAGFEITNVVLDANWTNWTGWVVSNQFATVASPAYVDGFKLGALAVKGRTGLVDHVEIRNCGANGIIPLAYWVGAGTECFPLLVDATRFEPGGPPTWYVQDCEVSDFHAVHAAYSTAIMVNTKNAPDAGTYTDYRAAIVRRCQVRGSGTEIGLGSAHSAGVAYYDNLWLAPRLASTTTLAPSATST